MIFLLELVMWASLWTNTISDICFPYILLERWKVGGGWYNICLWMRVEWTWEYRISNNVYWFREVHLIFGHLIFGRVVGSGLVYFFSLLPLCQLISFIHNSKAKKSIIIRYCGPWSKFQRPDDQSPTPQLRKINLVPRKIWLLLSLKAQ